MHTPARPKLPPLFGRVINPIQQFFHLEASSGIVLLAMALAAFGWANWPGSGYEAFFETPIGIELGSVPLRVTLRVLINDVLMSVFFFVVGLEIKRELARGELRTPAQAMLPAIAALGGMIVPAAIFYAFTRGTPGQVGWGIPMATDIAFTIGCLALLKSRVPHALVVFVTALAIFDDIGGILVIAIFYGSGLHVSWLLAGAAIVFAGLLLNRLLVRSWIPYAVVGILLWVALHHAGIHATIAGVILGMLVPARPGRSPRDVLAELGHHASGLAKQPADENLGVAEISAIEDMLEDLQAPLDRFVHGLHPIVAFGIMPAFALANAGVNVAGMGLSQLASPVALGAGLGLLVGKQLGIFGFTLAAVKFGVAPIPGKSTLTKLYGVSVVAGIGFTVALFIGTLAYPTDNLLLAEAKLGILIGSALAGVIGLAALRMTAPVGTAPAAPAEVPVEETTPGGAAPAA